MAQIELNDVTKLYRVHKRSSGLRAIFSRETTTIEALSHVSFHVEPGELVGYIGPNGAGKSTTIKIISGILSPDGGNVRVLGRVPWKERQAHAAHIGVVFGQRSQLWWDTPVSDSFELLRDIYRVPDADYRKRLCRLTELLDAGSLLKTPVRQLSLGQRMRCEIIAALLHAPEILFLDEPTIGLDAVTKLALRNVLAEMNRQGVTMLLTTHDMDDIEALCSRVMVLGKGRKLFDGSMQALRERFAPARLVRLRPTSPLSAVPPIPEAEEAHLEDGMLIVKYRPESVSVQAILARVASACEIADLTIEPENVERMVAAMYREFDLCAV